MTSQPQSHMLLPNGGCVTAGLFNQHLSLLSFLTIAIAAGADEVLVSGSKSRDRWAKDAAWIDSNFTDVWDVAAIEGFLAGASMMY